jgi:hypothetical protein
MHAQPHARTVVHMQPQISRIKAQYSTRNKESFLVLLGLGIAFLFGLLFFRALFHLFADCYCVFIEGL